MGGEDRFIDVVHTEYACIERATKEGIRGPYTGRRPFRLTLLDSGMCILHPVSGERFDLVKYRRNDHVWMWGDEGSVPFAKLRGRSDVTDEEFKKAYLQLHPGTNL